jgi:predicted dehydrogenase
MKRIPIAVIGAGLIGRSHVDRALKQPDVDLVGIADPSEDGRRVAESAAVAWFSDFERMLATVKPRAVVIATPNITHADIAVHCLGRGAAVLVEKPIADTLADAGRICDASATAGLPALVGHQRRYNPVTRRAKQIVDEGRLGRPVCVTAMSTWFKPAEYFDTQWRRRKGGGPILINLIHDIDQLRFLFGDVETVQAMMSNNIRGFEVEDTAVVLLRFRNGALGTFTVSDTATAPWNWDLAAGEAERFPRQDVNSHFLSGTDASLTLPRLEYWCYRSGKGWQDGITEERNALHVGDPYAEQLRHFVAVIEGKEQPVCSAADAMRSLETTVAVAEAAQSGRPITLTK